MTRPNLLSRRALLGAGAGVAASTALGTRSAQLASGADAQAAQSAVLKQSLLPPERIGLQLYSVRDSVPQLGFARVLETVAEIGFEQVEFAGYTQGSTPEITVKELRSLLDANGLVAAGSHVSPSDDASMKPILDDAEVLGIPQVGISLLLPSGLPTVSGWQAAAERFNRFGQLASERGMGFYLHNHFQEWLPAVDNPSRRGIDVLLEETDPKLVSFQLDIYWAYVGRFETLNGFDPLEDYAIPMRDRFKLFHVKDGIPATQQMRDVGEGQIDFQTFFTKLFAASPGEEEKHLYLWEYDNAADHPRGPLAAARSSFVNMRYGLYAPASAADAECGFQASVLKTAITRNRSGRRAVEVTLRLGAPATVDARVTRDGETIARRQRRVGPGLRHVEAPLARSVAAGPARLDLTVSNGAGASVKLRDTVRIPRRRAR